jgi:uncharacterized protein YgbK (DUF1537 family)
LTPEIQIAVVADDLTGALDAIAPFANAGLRCVVAMGPHSIAAALAQHCDVIAVSTNSREMTEELSISVNAFAAQALAFVPRVIKKIDSRLKGHVGAEVAVLARQRGFGTVLVCPAIPDMGRVVLDGKLRGFGVAEPLAIADILSNCADLQVLIPDVETDAQLDQLLDHTDPNTLLVGARGLTAAVARRMAGPARPALMLPLPHPVAFAIGSRDPITLAQVAELRRSHRQAGFLAAPNGVCAATPPLADILILQATPGSMAASSASVTTAFAESVVRLAVPGRASLVLTGGETAAAVLEALHIGVLLVLGEPLPGLPLCQPLDFPDAPLILTKSGGFGAYDVLSRLL